MTEQQTRRGHGPPPFKRQRTETDDDSRSEVSKIHNTTSTDSETTRTDFNVQSWKELVPVLMSLLGIDDWVTKAAEDWVLEEKERKDRIESQKKMVQQKNRKRKRQPEAPPSKPRRSKASLQRTSIENAEDLNLPEAMAKRGELEDERRKHARRLAYDNEYVVRRCSDGHIDLKGYIYTYPPCTPFGGPHSYASNHYKRTFRVPGLGLQIETDTGEMVDFGFISSEHCKDVPKNQLLSVGCSFAWI